MTSGVTGTGGRMESSETVRLLDTLRILPIIDRERQEARQADIARLDVEVREATEPDLFRPLSAGAPLTVESLQSRLAGKIRIVVSPACWLDITHTVDSLRLQAFLTLYRRTTFQFTSVAPLSEWNHVALEPTATAWAPSVHLADVVRLWNRIAGKQVDLEPIELATTARVYGNKVRLASSIASVMRAYLSDGTPVADLMCGSGVVSRVLSSSFEVLANDVNPWAAVLAGLQLRDVDRASVERFLNELSERYATNFNAGASIVAEELRREAEFLYGPVDAAAVERYGAFCAKPMLQTNETVAGVVRTNRAPSDGAPALLTVALFANAYFGLRQSLAIDSIRRAVAAELDTALREVWLGCLVLAANVCGSGPHFAQPPKMKSERSMRELLEHRSRDVLTEFAQLLRLLAERPPRPRMRTSVSCGDWRDALATFMAEDRGRARAAYIDPPYTRLQYARYYHVLNTLIEYRFSTPVGIGRYPRKDMRPASRFDGRERTARSELGELLSAAARNRLVTFLSYSSTGMVSLADLCRAMEERFHSVDAYTVPLRHHSQGRRLLTNRGQVDEFVLVGLP